LSIFKNKTLVFLLIILGAIAIFIIWKFPPEEYKFYPKCFIYVLTGYQCSGCGNLRASHAILHGDFRTAWTYNPSIFFLAPYLLTGLVLQVFTSKSEKAYKIFSILYHRYALLSILFLMILFMILRNIYI